jgi:hypothetical protein
MADASQLNAIATFVHWLLVSMDAFTLCFFLWLFLHKGLGKIRTN